MELDAVYNEDCLEGMKRIPDKSIDMILCDLPYGTTNCEWDTIIPLEPLWEQYKRIIKDHGAILLFAQIPFLIKLGASNLKWLRYKWTWDKRYSTGFLNCHRMPMKAHEDILVFYKHLPKYNPQKIKLDKPIKRLKPARESEIYQQKVISASGGIYSDKFPADVLRHKVAQNPKSHPTEKPVDLLEFLIKSYTDEGEVVLDNACGSGSTLVAAKNTNRHYIGFEINEKYYKIAKERLNGK